MTTLITLTLAGSDTGPFSIYSNVDGFTTPTVTGISRATLLAGYTATVPDNTTQVLVKSTGACLRNLYLTVSGAPTPTTTTTSSTTTVTPTTVRLDWSVGKQPGGQLTVFSNTGTQLLNITSTGGTAQSGTIYPLLTQLPYTIRGSWVSGPGNIIRFRVCDITNSGELYESGAIDSLVGYEDYIVTPTPYNTSVSLTAQNVPPSICPI
jgi:hypothetical protein